MSQYMTSSDLLPFHPADDDESITFDEKHATPLSLAHQVPACLYNGGEGSCLAEKYVALFIPYSNVSELVLFSALSLVSLNFKLLRSAHPRYEPRYCMMSTLAQIEILHRH